MAMLFALRDTYIRIHAGVTDDGADLTLMRNRGLPTDWLVFPAPAGQPNQPRHPDAVTNKFMAKAKKILGYEIRLHDLRVTCGTLLLDRGVPVHVVAKRLGHDPAVLLRTYAKRTKGGDDQAADVIGAITRTLGGKQ
jgi:integrase